MRTAASGKVLVFGDDTRSFLTIVRSLGRRGIEVHAAPANFRSPALHSRYIAKIHDLPPWMGDGAGWLAAMESLLPAERFDLVIPCDETTLLPLQRHRERMSALARLAIPDDRAIDILFDKFKTRELALRTGVPVAKGRLLRPDDAADAVLHELGAPVVVKPRYSYSLDTIATRGRVQVVQDPALLNQVLTERDPQETVLEQFFAGQGQGVSLLASRGRILQAFEHHRVREIAGASFYRVSAPLTPDLVRACEAIVSAVQYTGLAMFEFKRNERGDWILLEINARPWGSMPLPVSLGVDFPYRWFQLLTAGEETPAVSYRAGIYGRNLTPDLRAIMTQARSLGWTARTSFIIRRAVELLRPLQRREAHDVFVADDPRPAFFELAAQTAALLRRANRLVPVGSARRQRVGRLVYGDFHHRAGKPLVLFVCQGNICRSPFAEALLQSRVAGQNVAVGSAGMMPQPGRTTPDLGQQAARAFAVDLSAHRSVWLTRQMAESAALLVVFDDVNRTALFDRYPYLRVPVINLGELVGLGSILDPVDGDLAEFGRIYEQIAAGVAELALLLGARSRSEFSVSLSNISSLEELERQWSLLGLDNDGSFFTSWSWIGTWLALLPSSIKPQLLKIERDGRCCGAAIAVRRDTRGFGMLRHLHLNETGDPRLDSVTIEHNDLIGKMSGDITGWQALLSWFESGAADADELSISGVTDNIAGSRRRRFLLLSDRKTPAYRVDLATLRISGGRVGSILSANSRQQLNRSMRAFASFGPLQLEAAKDVDEGLAFFDALKRLHIASWTRRGQRHGFAYPFVERFHRSLIKYCFPRGEVELLRLRAGTRELGYLYNFFRNGVVYAYQSGFDDRDRRLRPGYVAHALAIERSASLGALSYDFMAGSNRLKESFATDHYAMHWYVLQRPLFRFRAVEAVRAVRLRLQR